MKHYFIRTKIIYALPLFVSHLIAATVSMVVPTWENKSLKSDSVLVCLPLLNWGNDCQSIEMPSNVILFLCSTSQLVGKSAACIDCSCGYLQAVHLQGKTAGTSHLHVRVRIEISVVTWPLSVASLGAFAKLRNATVCYVMSACPSVRMEQLGCHWADFYEIWYLCIFRISVGKIQVSLKSE